MRRAKVLISPVFETFAVVGTRALVSACLCGLVHVCLERETPALQSMYLN
jgi:hypothetical protein